VTVAETGPRSCGGDICVYNLPDIKNKPENCICQSQITVPFYREKSQYKSSKDVAITVDKDLNCGYVRGSGTFHFGKPNPKIGSKCSKAEGIFEKICIIDGDYYNISKNIAIVSSFWSNDATYGDATCVLVNTDGTEGKISTTTCAAAGSKIECDLLPQTVCGWSGSYCLVKTICELSKEEKQAAGNQVICCKIQTNTTPPYTYKYNYASLSNEDKAGNKKCADISCGNVTDPQDESNLTECRNARGY
jgi:hypothetical protein